MWTPEEKESRLSELLEFLNNDLKSNKEQDVFYTLEVLKDHDIIIKLRASLKALLNDVQAQINRNSTGSKILEPGRKDLKGISNYITKASLEELQELNKRIDFHLHTIIFYSQDRLLED